MVFHYIAVFDDYEKGQRLVWHYASETRLDKEHIQHFMEEVRRNGHPWLGIHRMSTNSVDFNSVREKCLFFEDAVVAESLDYFIERIASEPRCRLCGCRKAVWGYVDCPHDA